MTGIKEKFISSIKRGTGEVFQILKQNPQLDFFSEIIKAAIKNYTPNVQDEGTRSRYIYELANLSPNKSKIRKAILKGLSEGKNDSDTLDQLYGIAYLYAKQGDKEFYNAIYKRYFSNRIKHADSLGEYEILKLDGINGLKYIAEIRGRNLKKNPRYWKDDSLIKSFQEDNPKLDVLKDLKNAGKTNSNIKRYLETIQNYKSPIFKKEKIKITAEFVEKRIAQNKIVPLHGDEIKQLSKSDILKIADNFLKETKRIRKEKYLRIFSYIKFPFGYMPLLKEAKQKDNRKDRLIEFACDSLKFFKNNNIRRFAIKQIPKSKFPSIYISLLITNYKSGDGKMLTKLVKKEEQQWKIHSLAMSYIDLYKKNKAKDCKQPLIELYDKLTCGHCRHEIIKIMIDNKVLPFKIKKEIHRDSYEETRKLWKKLVN
ncbi:MAG TPA: hypothetical protein VHP32_11155 [Ignavibacteria bacterium]|nr:hypothetical protein [Ignavibacteria bacterium]